jgi:hypothetical protein
VLITLAVIASSCASESTDMVAADVETQKTAETTYAESLKSISAEMDSIIEEAFESVFAQAEGLAFEALLPALSAALGKAISVQQDAIARYEALAPPQKLAADHERHIQVLRDQIEAWTRQQAAADAGDTELVAQIDLELQSLTRQALADLSSGFAQYIVDESAEVFGELFAGLDSDETNYLNAVAEGWDEFARRNRDFGAALQQSYANDEALLQALLNAGAGEAFAVVRAVIVEIDPPASYADGHDRLVAYLDETVALDSIIAKAAENGDVVGFEVANYELALAGARFTLEAPPSLVSVISDPVDQVPPPGLPGGTYGDDLWQALGRFRTLALRQQIFSGVFPVVSEGNQAATIAAVMPTTIQLTNETIAEIEALEPPAELQKGHVRILAYLGELLNLRRSVLQAATIGDLDALRTYGELGGFAAQRAETELWCEALADMADDPIEPITATFFRPFEVATLTQLCPAA